MLRFNIIVNGNPHCSMIQIFHVLFDSFVIWLFNLTWNYSYSGLLATISEPSEMAEQRQVTTILIFHKRDFFSLQSPANSARLSMFGWDLSYLSVPIKRFIIWTAFRNWDWISLKSHWSWLVGLGKGLKIDQKDCREMPSQIWSSTERMAPLLWQPDYQCAKSLQKMKIYEAL